MSTKTKQEQQSQKSLSAMASESGVAQMTVACCPKWAPSPSPYNVLPCRFVVCALSRMSCLMSGRCHACRVRCVCVVVRSFNWRLRDNLVHMKTHVRSPPAPIWCAQTLPNEPSQIYIQRARTAPDRSTGRVPRVLVALRSRYPRTASLGSCRERNPQTLPGSSIPPQPPRAAGRARAVSTTDGLLAYGSAPSLISIISSEEQ